MIERRRECDGDDFVTVHAQYEDGSFECLFRVVDVHIFRHTADRAHLRVGRCGDLCEPKKIAGDYVPGPGE